MQHQLTIAHWISEALSQKVVYDPDEDYKSHAVIMQDTAAKFLWDEADRLEQKRQSRQGITKLELLRLAAIRGAVREVEDIYAGDCPRAWLAWHEKQG